MCVRERTRVISEVLSVCLGHPAMSVRVCICWCVCVCVLCSLMTEVRCVFVGGCVRYSEFTEVCVWVPLQCVCVYVNVCDTVY